jgi:hypothetical protein
MAKSGAFLGILGILLGVGGIGFGVINWMNQPTIPYEPYWYSYHDTDYTPTPASVYIPIPNISIVFELGAPMSLHLLFTCSARCLGDAVSFSDLFFYFMINDVRQVDMPWARVGSYESNTNYEYYSVSLQHYIELVTPGVYNFTVVILTERVGNFIRETSFWIQSYIA